MFVSRFLPSVSAIIHGFVRARVCVCARSPCVIRIIFCCWCFFLLTFLTFVRSYFPRKTRENKSTYFFHMYEAARIDSHTLTHMEPVFSGKSMQAFACSHTHIQMTHTHNTRYRIDSLIHLNGIHGTRKRITNSSSNNNNENVKKREKKEEKKTEQAYMHVATTSIII